MRTGYLPLARREGQAAEADKGYSYDGEGDELAALKRQLSDLQTRLDRITKKSE